MKKILLGASYILSFLFFFTVCVVWIAIPEEVILNAVVSAFFAIFLISVIILDLKRWQKLYRSKQFYKFSGHFITALLLLGILGLINYLAYKHPQHWDLTTNAQNSLTAQSVKVATQLEAPLEVLIFARKNEFGPILKLLDLYRYHKNDIQFETINVELSPAEVGAYGISVSPTLVFKYQGKRQYISELNELSVTNAMIKVSRERDPMVCYSTGHGEGDVDKKEEEGLSFLQRKILDSNLVLKTLSLIEKNEIDKECDLFLIWGPSEDFGGQEIAAVENYLISGGHLMVGIDPNVNEESVPALRALLRRWGVSVVNGLVVDSQSHVNGSKGTAPIIKVFEQKHPISREFSLPVLLPLTGAIASAKGSAHEGEFTALAASSPGPAAWLDLKPAEIIAGDLTFDPKVDVPGPLVFAAAWKQKPAEGKALIVAFANSTFVSNSYQRFTGNFNFFLNALLWGVDEGRLISFDLPGLPDEPIFISGPQKGIIFYFSVLFVPLAFLTLGLIAYWRKKKQ